MEQKTQPNDVWTEVRATDEGVSITLYSETEGEIIVEDETWYTLDELTSNDNNRTQLTLSENPLTRLSDDEDEDEDEDDEDDETGSTDQIDDYQEFYGTIPLSTSEKAECRLDIDEGDVLVDIEGAQVVMGRDKPKVEVTNVTSERASDYDITVDGETVTVAEENPDYPIYDLVVEGQYVKGGDRTYAFPVSRLENIGEQDES
jgi:hypothetical protein